MDFLTGRTDDCPDFTSTLRDATSWRTGRLWELDLAGHVTTMAIDPIRELMAIGTSKGCVNIYGSPPSTVRFALRNARPKFLAFAQAVSKIICIGESTYIYGI